MVCIVGFQQWSVEHFHTCRPGSGWLHSTDTQQDQHIVCEKQWLPEQNPGKKSRHMLHLLSHQGQLGTLCLQQDSDHMCLWPGYHLHHDTVKHSYSVAMKESTGERNGTLLSLVMSLYANDGHTHVWRRPGVHHLQECFCSWHTGPSSNFMVWEAVSYNSLSHLLFLQDKVKSACYIAQVVNPVLQPFLRQEGDVFFQQDNAGPHRATVMQHALCGIRLSWPAVSPDLSPIEHRRRFRGGARGPRPPLSDHTTIIIKFSGPVLKYFLHSFFIVY